MQNKLIALSFPLVYFIFCVLSSPTWAIPPNLTLAKKAVIQYHDQGTYEQDLTAAIQKAQKYIIKSAKSHPNQKLAVVLDIDETSLSNYNKMVKRDFVGSHEEINQEILRADAPVIKPMLALYNESLRHNVKVFFVTGRTESQRKATEANLKRAGYQDWAGLYLRPNIYKNTSIIPFKSKTREIITKQGYTVIATIGDQYSDLKGGYAQKGFKLPNPFYYLP